MSRGAKTARGLDASGFRERAVPGYRQPQPAAKVLLPGHCHHNALMKMSDEESLLRKMGADVEWLDTGCCGMAGVFGLMKDKFEL